MRIPVKWRIVEALHGLQIITSALMIVLVFYIYYVNTKNGSDPGQNIVFSSLGILLFLFVLFFNIINIYLLQKYYPDQILSAGLSRLYGLSLVLYILSTAVFSFLSYFAFQELMKIYEANKYFRIPVKPMLGAMIGLFVWIFTLLCGIIFSLRLRKLIQINSGQKQIDDIEGLGII